MVEIEVTVADRTRIHGLMRRLRHLFESEAVIYDPAGKTVRVRAEWESRTVDAVVEAVHAWMNESKAASATLAIGNRSFTLVSPDASRSDAYSEMGALALITEVVRSAHGAQDSIALLTRACESISHAFGFERAGIARRSSATGAAEVVASYEWPLEELTNFARLPDVQSILPDA